MKEVRRCIRCILPESLPSVELDENNVCKHCREYDALLNDWQAIRAKRKSEFEDLLMQARQLKRHYDCLIPLSGGKDSTYALYLCSKVYGLRCLCITFDNGFMTEYARKNIKSGLSEAGADHLLYSINRDLLLKLYKLFLAKSGNFCSVCMRGIHVSTQRAAKAFNVPLIISGGGARISYVNMFPEVFKSGGDLHFFQSILAEEPLERDAAPLLGTDSRQRQALKTQLHKLGLKATASKLLQFVKRAAYRSSIMPEFLVPKPAISISLYDYWDASPAEVYDTIRQEMGWKSPPGQLEHMDCALHELGFYIPTRKFPELTPHTFYRSSLIRRGLITREEAMRAEEDELANHRVPQILETFLMETRMSADDFEASMRI
jgi:hypothetical protein